MEQSLWQPEALFLGGELQELRPFLSAMPKATPEDLGKVQSLGSTGLLHYLFPAQVSLELFFDGCLFSWQSI